jgi:hypothetical protein
MKGRFALQCNRKQVQRGVFDLATEEKNQEKKIRSRRLTRQRCTTAAACHSIEICTDAAAIRRASTATSHPRTLTTPPAPTQEGRRRKLPDHCKKKDEEGGARLPGANGSKVLTACEEGGGRSRR